MREKDLFRLEFHKIRQALKELCLSEPAKQASMALLPGTDPEEITSELESVEEALGLLKLGVRLPIEDFPDLEAWLKEAEPAGSFLDGKRLAAILATLKMAGGLRSSL